MGNELRLAAFIEYVMRPLIGDVRGILDELKGLNVGISEATAKKLVLAFGLWHITGELIRAVSYVGVTWVICHALVRLSSSL